MDDMKSLEAMAERGRIAAEAKDRYGRHSGYQGWLRARYDDWHRWYAPPINADQWPQARAERPGKIHVTTNIIKPVVDVNSRLQSILPRITIPSSSVDVKERPRAEAAEKLIMAWLDRTDWDIWLPVTCRVKSIYGKSILKPIWDKREKRGDVVVIENPSNLMLFWGASDFSTLDGALYEYALSYDEVMRRWPGCSVERTGNRDQPWRILSTGTHDDPLNQKSGGSGAFSNVASENLQRVIGRDLTDYEQTHLRVWDYWYLRGESVYNCILVEGSVVDGPHEHPEMLDIPYIVIENDHEPGSPEGMSDIDHLIDLQDQINLLVSHGFQHIADNIDPAWVVSGEDASTIPDGMVPKAGQIQPIGNSKIDALNSGVNTFPFTDMANFSTDLMYIISGLSPLQMGQIQSGELSGRALAVQIESSANRLDPKRRLLYRGLRTLIRFWCHMADVMNPTFDAGQDEDGNPRRMGLRDVVKGFDQWKIVAPEITPKDVMEAIRVEIDKVNAKVSSRRAAMDAIGVDAPEAELELVKTELSDIQLNPDQVQIQAAVWSLLLQLQSQYQQLSQTLGQVQGSIAQQGGQSPLATAQAATNQGVMAGYQAQPTGLNDQGAPPSPMTQGTTPPPGQGTGPQLQGLVRPGQALSQIAF